MSPNTFKVLISGGGSTWDELKYNSPSGNFFVKNFEPLSVLLKENDFAGIYESFENYDAIIFKLSGENPGDFLSKLNEHNLYEKYKNRNFVCAFWSQDTHLFYEREVNYSSEFDQVYTAHSSYIEMFEKGKAFHLPCSWTLTSPETLSGIEIKSCTPAVTVFSPFRIYKGFERNILALEIMKILKDKKISYFFGEVIGDARIPSIAVEILKSKIILNLSIARDLNMRTFEALALNRILLTDEVPDHKKVNLDYGNTFFFNRDLSNFEEALQEALNHKKVTDSRSNILLDNTINARIRELVSFAFNIPLTTIEELPSRISFMQNSFTNKTKIRKYSPFEILLNCPKGYQLEYFRTKSVSTIFWTIFGENSAIWFISKFIPSTAIKLVRKLNKFVFAKSN